MQEDIVKVVACVCERDGRYMLALRPEGKARAGLWEFPGGKLEEGENHHQAAVRELKEELALKVVSVGEPVFIATDIEPSCEVAFCEVNVANSPKCLEHEEVRWVEREELLNYPMHKSDKEFVEAFLAQT